MKHLVALLSMLFLLAGPAMAQETPWQQVHTHAQCLASQVHLDAVAAAVAAATADCEAARAQLQQEYDAAIANLRAEMEGQAQSFEDERVLLLQERDALQAELSQARIELAQREAMLSKSESMLTGVLITAAKVQEVLTPIVFPTEVSLPASTEILAPEGAVRAYFGIGMASAELGAGPYIGHWSVHPIVDGRLKLEFAGAKPGPINGVIRWEFPPASLQEIVANVVEPLSVWPASPSINTTNTTQAVILGDVRRAEETVRIVGVRAYRASADIAAPKMGHIWAGGQKIREVPLTCPDVGWCTGYFADAVVVIDKDVEFIVSYEAPQGWSGQTGYFGTTEAPLTPTANGMTILSGIYAYPTTPGYPMPSVKFFTNYWADVLTVPIK